jgi:rhamnulokinase
MAKSSFLAFDLGAESGRSIIGKLDNGRLTLHETHRFPNAPVRVRGHLHWDIYRLFEELKIGYRKSLAGLGEPPRSLGIDTWGVDFGLLGEGGELLGLPFAYRDPQTDGMVDRYLRATPAEEVYSRTGIQFQPFNTLIQLYALRQRKYTALDRASSLLFMPDLLSYFFTGVPATEYSFATTSQLYNPLTHTWDQDLLATVGLRPSFFQSILQTGTVLGPMAPDVADELSSPALPLIAVATHDTGSAVAAVPAEGTDWGYISSGTWSLMGIETDAPVLSRAALAANFTNEGGVDGTIRFLSNIMGLWLIQECRRRWSAEKEYSYEELMALATTGPPFRSLVDPDWQGFYHPPDMPQAIRDYCRTSSQPEPETHAQVARCVFESLALKYRATLESLRSVTGKRIEALHIIGGGSRNRLLCQFTANATGVPVLAGPAEATAIGNIMVQARSLGHVDSLAAMRDVIRRSWAPPRYLPEDVTSWQRAFEKFQTLIQARV